MSKMVDEYVEAVVARYGVASALARTRRMTHDRHYRHKPQWLAQAIKRLTEMEKKSNFDGSSSK